MAGEIDKAIYRFLDTAGNGTGTKNAIGDYSTTATEFKFSATSETMIHRMLVYIVDAIGTPGVGESAFNEYGNLGASLTNGYSICVRDTGNTTLSSLTDGINIRANQSFARYCYDTQILTNSATSNEVVSARWTFARAGEPLRLLAGQRLSITLNDTLTGLIEHYFMVQGYQTDR